MGRKPAERGGQECGADEVRAASSEPNVRAAAAALDRGGVRRQWRVCCQWAHTFVKKSDQVNEPGALALRAGEWIRTGTCMWKRAARSRRCES